MGTARAQDPWGRGAALAVALLAMALLLVLASTFLGTSSTEMEIAANARDAARALYLAESGLARLQRDLLTQFAGPYRARCPALPTFATLRRPLLLTGEPLGLPGQRLDADGSATCGPPGAAAFYPILDEGNQPVSPEGPTWRTIPYAAAGTDGEYRVEVRNATADTLEARVRAGIGAATGASRHLEATLQVARFSPAEHAVFVDGGIWPLRSEGAQGPLLIAGPVFAKGWSGTYPALRLGYGGAADRIVNWYRGMDAALQAAVPPLAAGSAGEASLGATVRVFQGPVEVSHAAASVGEPSLPGNGLKEALDGVYTNHGFTGNPGASAVYADTGAGGRFDLPRELVAFPDLGGPYTGPPLPGGTDPPSHDASLRDGALGIEGGLVVDANTPSFSYPPGYSDLRECAGPCLIYRSGQVAADGTPASPPALRIQGIVWVKGDIALGGLGAQRLPAIRYEGSGTLYARAGAAADVPATGSITVTADLLPPAGLPAPSDPSGAAGRFPRDHRLGLIAAGWTLLGDWTSDPVSSQGSSPPTLRIAASLFSNFGLYNYWPYQIAGSVMTRYLYVRRAASLYYLPDLARGRPPGMPGVVAPKSGSPYFVRTLAWRDIVP